MVSPGSRAFMNSFIGPAGRSRRAHGLGRGALVRGPAPPRLGEQVVDVWGGRGLDVDLVREQGPADPYEREVEAQGDPPQDPVTEHLRERRGHAPDLRYPQPGVAQEVADPSEREEPGVGPVENAHAAVVELSQ